MMKLLFALKCAEHPAHEVLHELVLRGLDVQGSSIQELADEILQKSQPLIKSGQLKNELLTISIHKVKSTEWNTLLVRYLDPPFRFQLEIKKEQPQTTLFA